MKGLFVSVAMGVGALVCLSAHADAPTGSTALCKDGSYYSGKSKRGACSGHEGIKDWYGDKAATSAAAPPAAQNSAATAAMPAAATAPTASSATDADAPKKHRKKKVTDTAPATATAAASPAATATSATADATAATAAAPKKHGKHEAPTPAKDIVQKPGGGAGLVWVNSASKVYHCQSDEWYGKTKEGSYMSEAAAKSAGAHGAGNKDCTK